jgi:hypothetical protein
VREICQVQVQFFHLSKGLQWLQVDGKTHGFMMVEMM